MRLESFIKLLFTNNDVTNCVVSPYSCAVVATYIDFMKTSYFTQN